ncbi:MAG TPA: CHC2 zinc finger domain-containing protein [Polyangiaceae bacterium]|nr:CHC2 zinc finger domain-containing protein [Polyangiaceae bacterium]
MISQETIEAVRHQVSIVSVIGDRVRLERRGQSHVGLCPFHKEKSPSFHVNAERGFFYCFGCQAGGNVISFVQQLDGLTFPEAVRELAERAGIEVTETGSLDERKRETEERRRREELFAAVSIAAEYFERCLEQHPLAPYALAELGRRQLEPARGPQVAEALRSFRVGYAPYGWDGLSRHLRQLNFNLRAAEAVGLIGERKSGDGHYDRFRHRLMFAVIDLQGKVIAFSGRALEEPSADDLRRANLAPARSPGSAPSEPPAKYYNSPESPIYRKRDVAFGLYQARQAIREQDRCVVVEGNFDVLSLHAQGVRNVVAPLGTAFTLEQARQIARYTRQVTFLFDGDAAGQRATHAAREPCQKEGLLPRVARLPKGLDPDELVREGGKAAIERVLQGSRALLEHLIDVALESGFATDDAAARAGKIREVKALIDAEEDPVVRDMARRYADEINGRLGILGGGDGRSMRTLQSAVAGSAAQPSVSPGASSAPPERARSPSRVDAIRYQILGAALEYPDLLRAPEIVALLTAADGDLALGLATLRALHAESAGAPLASDPARFVAEFPEALRPQISMRLAAPELSNREAAQEVLTENLQKLARLHGRVERASVVEELRRASASGDVDAQMELLQRQMARAKARHGL